MKLIISLFKSFRGIRAIPIDDPKAFRGIRASPITLIDKYIHEYPDDIYIYITSSVWFPRCKSNVCFNKSPWS